MESNIENIEIDGFNYEIKHIKFDIHKLDCDGRCDDYCDKAYVIKDEKGIRVREISYFNDDNNEEDAFNSRNYSKSDLFVVLSHGDDSWDLSSFYEIIWTNNKTGLINTDYKVNEVLNDLVIKSKSKP